MDGWMDGWMDGFRFILETIQDMAIVTDKNLHTPYSATQGCKFN